MNVHRAENVAHNNENLFFKYWYTVYKNSLQKCYYESHHLHKAFLFHTNVTVILPVY